ncbi:hypothetical protein SADUNF_Sadunf18G0059600 [Salix dunnii]|uniref:Uncharacterized protein n=1 Tax=Salix dunnii TaxID=1413687 RepID=A0A835J820_9ROSI|nr:hypothetical protein SADUNF_Sadunf18G0059600 [Salix dunnii]
MKSSNQNLLFSSQHKTPKSSGMSVAMSSLSGFDIGSAEGYAEYVEQWENAIAKCSRVLVFFDS